ncbi:MAG: hypothetical protein GY813_03180 [Halieaceae bacterium]|nr:hypothetical protein [Halieaceae bacterium]
MRRSKSALFLTAALGDRGGELGLCGTVFENSGPEDSGPEDSGSTGAAIENGVRGNEGMVPGGKARDSGPDFRAGGVKVVLACPSGF